MPFVLEVLLLLVTLLLPLGLLLLGIVALTVGLCLRKTWLTITGFVACGIMVIVAMGAFLLLTFSPQRTIQERASAIVTLPNRTAIVSVEEGNWAGDGRVMFRLPDGPSREAMDEIWEGASAGFPVDLADTEHHREGRQGEEHRSLQYDPQTGVFTYKVVYGL